MNNFNLPKIMKFPRQISFVSKILGCYRYTFILTKNFVLKKRTLDTIMKFLKLESVFSLAR